MRVNNNLTPEILAGIQRTQSEEQTALQELSTGKRVNVPSDDPAAAVAMIQNQLLTSAVDQYTKNVTSILSVLQTADSTLSSVQASVNQAITLGTEGANGTVTAAQRQALAQQVQGIFSSVLSAANLNYNGVYVFGGTDENSQPYAADSGSSTGYAYSGNDETNSVEIGSGYSIQINLPGGQLFSSSGSDLLGSLNQLATALQSGTSTDISSATSQVESALSYFNQQREFYGNAMSQLSSQESFLSQEKVNLSSEENTLVGADATQAATMLSQAQTSNSAILAAAAKILPESLLNYLQ